MPSYQYRCPYCGIEETRYNIRIEHADNQYCDQCRDLMDRQVSMANFALKGTGWTEKTYK